MLTEKISWLQGSTGTPKGVILTHGNLVSSCGAVYHLLYEIFNEQDVYLAYLCVQTQFSLRR